MKQDAQSLHYKTLAVLARYTGQVMPAAFFKKTSDHVPSLSIERFHNLVTGIFKPAWSDYALCIMLMPGSRYEQKDEVIHLSDGRWLMRYSPRSGGLNQPDNRALIRCKDDRMPFGVIQQITDKTRRSTYRILGLGILSNYDSARDEFIVESADLAALMRVSEAVADEVGKYEMLLYAQLTNDFRPVVAEERTQYVVSAPKRDQAFRELLLREYDYACAVCSMKFHLDNLYEAQAAHIVPKRRNGTDDPRNGLALCRTHHWAFDVGLFSLTPDYEILVSPIVEHAESRKFELLSLAGETIRAPERDVIIPHPTAVNWHRENVFRQ